MSAVLSRVAARPEALRELLDAESVPLIAFTADRVILAANPAAEQFFGYERRELEARSTDLIVPERFRQPDAPPTLATRDLTTVEIPGLHRDGSEVAVVWTYGFAPGKDGPIFILIIQDSQRVAREQEDLRRSDARYRSLLLVSTALVWITDADGRFVEPQPGWEDYTGQDWETYRGSGWISAVHPDDRAQVMDDWQAAVRARADVYRTQGRLWSARHGAFRAFQSRGVPVRARTGEIVEWIGALTDVQDTVDALDRLERRERELEHRFRTVYENALDGILLIDDALRVVDANPAACRLLGRARERLIGASGTELTPPADREKHPTLFGEFRAAGAMVGEGRMLLPDGTVRRAEFGAVASVSPGTHLTMFRDIEDRKRAEEAREFLDEASRLLASSHDFDDSLASVASLATRRVADWVRIEMLEEDGSFRCAAMAHSDGDKIELAHEIRSQRPPSLQDRAGIGAVVRTGAPELIELVTDDLLASAFEREPSLSRAIRGLGLVSRMTVPLSARGVAIGAISIASAESRRRYGWSDLDFAAELARRIGFAIENALLIRDLRSANRTKDLFLRRAEHLQATATQLVRAQSVRDIAQIFDTEDRAPPLDAQGTSLFLRAGDVLELVAATPELRPTAQRWAPMLLADESPLPLAARTGEALWLKDLAEFVARFPNVEPSSLRPDIDGRAAIPLVVGTECIGVLGVTFRTPRTFDSDERAYLTAVANLWGQALYRARLAEAEREAIQRALLAETLATRKKDEFLAILGHELRNPLAPIVTAISLVRDRGWANSRELEVLDRQSRHLVRLVDDLLDVSRATSGKLTLSRVHVGLADVLAQAVESTARLFDDNGVRLFTDLGPPALAVDGDRERLVQVVTNVLINAAKFTPAGKAVHLRAFVRGARALIVVRDEGQGIEPDLLPQIFDLFTQARQGRDRRSGGLGLGLSIARSIVAAHEGRIEAESAGTGLGTTITIDLPVSWAEERESRDDGSDRTAPPPFLRRVLIVDDNADSGEMLAAFLSRLGYECLTAGDGAGALSISLQALPDVAILDIGLPDMDGYELAQRMRAALDERAPVLIALTGYAQESDRRRSREHGFAEHLAKPVDMPRLAATLQSLLERRRPTERDSSRPSRLPSTP